MSNSGYIALHRKLLDWEWFSDADTLQVFIYLMLRARHKPGQWQGVPIDRGQVITGRKKLSKELNLSERRIRTILARLEQTGEISQKSTNRHTLVTLIKYSDYQKSDQQNDQRPTNDRPATDQQPTTNNNDNNDNNILLSGNSPGPGRQKYKFAETDMTLARFIFGKVLLVNPGTKEPNYKKWANDIRLMREQDDRTTDHIRAVFLWANKDSFWQSNILSTDKLRKQFDTLAARMSSKTNGNALQPAWSKLPAIDDQLADFAKNNGLPAPMAGEYYPQYRSRLNSHIEKRLNQQPQKG